MKNKLEIHMKTRGIYMEKYDSFYNPEKDIWLEQVCCSTECEFCKDRPNKPSECKDEW